MPRRSGRRGGTLADHAADRPSRCRAANAQALHDLENGANGLTLVFAGANGAHGFGLDPSAEAVEKVLDGVFSMPVLASTSDRPAVADGRHPRRRIYQAKGINPPPAISASVSIRSAPARSGDRVPIRGPRSCPRSPAPSNSRHGLQGPLAVADGRVIHDAGGSEAQELAFVLRRRGLSARLESAGIPLEDARGMI